jgi:hypothetical protein
VDEIGPEDVRGAVLRLAAEIAALRQAMADQSVEVLTRLDKQARRWERLEERLDGLETVVREAARRDASPSRGAVPPAVGGAPVRTEALVAQVAETVREVLATESALTRERIREAIDARSDRDDRALGAGLTRLASRLGEEVGALRHDLIEEVDGWFEELPSEGRLADIAARLDTIAATERAR